MVRKKPSLVQGLHDLCRRATGDGRIKTMVEVGSLYGESAEIFAQYFTTVYAVDCWDAEGIGPYAQVPQKVEAAFDDRIKALPNVIKIKGRSPEIAEEFEHGCVDFVYIDAEHGYPHVAADIAAWLPVCRIAIGGHDYTSYPGVARAVNERFKNVETFGDSSWFVYL